MSSGKLILDNIQRHPRGVATVSRGVTGGHRQESLSEDRN